MIKILQILLLLTVTVFSSEKQTLTIYTYDAFAASWGPAPKIKKAFEKKYTNYTLKFVAVSSSIGALRKIQLEGKRTKADILLGLDTSIAQVAKKTNLFLKHNLTTNNISLPINYLDDTFVPFDYSYFAFVYDENKLTNIPNSFEELASMPDDFKIVIQDPRSSTPGLGLVLWIKSVYGQNASSYWKRLSPHILTITKGWSEAYNLFLKNEADMVLSFTTSPAYHIIEENKTNIKAAAFKEGHYGQIEVASILKSSKNIPLAKKFLKFLHSEPFANIIPTSNWAYPVIKSVKLPIEFQTLHKPKNMILIDGKIVQLNKKEIINEFFEAIRK